MRKIESGYLEVHRLRQSSIGKVGEDQEVALMQNNALRNLNAFRILLLLPASLC